ncbi:MAG: hypothetical protein RIB84_25295 [Sneathiellaceae bacterium]
MVEQRQSGTRAVRGRQRNARRRAAPAPAALARLAALACLAGLAGLAALPQGAAAAEPKATAQKSPPPRAVPFVRSAPPPIGFGSIPFGTEADAALALNNGNGTLTYAAQGPATFRYPVVLAGLQFQVTQNFDDDNRAIDAQAVYTSGEVARSCVARFNFLLNGLNSRYGPPTVVPDVLQENRGGNLVSLYAAQYDFSDRTSIRGTVETTAPADAAAAAAGTNCRIVLHYYPPGWLATY